MKFLFDLFPVLLFFGAYSITGNIFIATGTAITATFAQVIYSWVRHRQVDTMLWVSLVLITVLGGATLLFHNKTFIYWKPTVLYWVFALALLGGHYLKRVNLIEKLMGTQISLPAPIWYRLLLAWVIFFLVLGALNLFVVHLVTSQQIGEDMWVKFKVFGTLVLTLVFVVLQSIYLSRFIETGKSDDHQG
ncbi:MAG: septation protein [Proteobacteria bacterium]|nr:septation protein [Pseudomonadota bacterium]